MNVIYAVLKNSLIVQQPSGDHDKRIIKISCDAKEAQNLLALAADVCPDAIPPIEKALPSLGRRFRLTLPLPFIPRISTPPVGTMARRLQLI